MAQNQRKKKQASSSSGISARIVAVSVALVVVLAAGIAVFASGGSDNGSSSDSTVASVPGGSAPGEFQNVDVEGEALDPLGKGAADPSLGKVGPNLSGHNFTGLSVSVNPATSGEPTMLVFLAHWCPHCNAEMPRLVNWYDKGLVPPNLRVIGVATASRKDQSNWPPSEWMQSFDWPFEVLADSETNQAAAAYGVDGYPFMVILDKDGKVVARHSGEMDEAEIPNFVNKALGL